MRFAKLQAVFARIVAVSVAGAAFSSCVISHPDYPSGWAPVEPRSASSCPDVSGMFENQSVKYGGVLGNLLIRSGSAERPPPGRYGKHTPIDARITQPREGVLEIQTFAYRGDTAPEASASFSREKGDFDCDSGWIVFKSSTGAGTGDGMGPGVTHFTVAIGRSSDGLLVARVSFLAAGLALGIVPVGGSMTEWHQFRPAAPLPDRNAPLHYP